MSRRKGLSLDLVIGAGSLLDMCPAGDEHGDSYLHEYERRVRPVGKKIPSHLVYIDKLTVELTVNKMNDEESLRSDWISIGRDMEKAFESYDRERRSQKVAG
ncbi:hypothetical protein [Pseudaeromonas paramecii]|uniref:Uncharacterized protein n=1 Tax=Pseudaeromonas paramecii TaxID=2138166 RepID=A0ABP8PWA5_9GAMM